MGITRGESGELVRASVCGGRVGLGPGQGWVRACVPKCRRACVCQRVCALGS